MEEHLAAVGEGAPEGAPPEGSREPALVREHHDEVVGPGGEVDAREEVVGLVPHIPGLRRVGQAARRRGGAHGRAEPARLADVDAGDLAVGLGRPVVPGLGQQVDEGGIGHGAEVAEIGGDREVEAMPGRSRIGRGDVVRRIAQAQRLSTKGIEQGLCLVRARIERSARQGRRRRGGDGDGGRHPTARRHRRRPHDLQPAAVVEHERGVEPDAALARDGLEDAGDQQVDRRWLLRGRRGGEQGQGEGDDCEQRRCQADDLSTCG